MRYRRVSDVEFVAHVDVIDFGDGIAAAGPSEDGDGRSGCCGKDAAAGEGATNALAVYCYYKLHGCFRARGHGPSR